MSLSSDISTTSTSLNAIKQAIIAKGVTPSGNITTYATAIGNIQTGGGVSFSWGGYEELEIFNQDFETTIIGILQQLENNYTPYLDFSTDTVTWKDANDNDFSYSAGGYNFTLDIYDSFNYYQGAWGIPYVIEVSNGIGEVATVFIIIAINT